MVKLKHILMGVVALVGIGGIAYAMMPKKYTFGDDLTSEPVTFSAIVTGYGDKEYKSPASGKLIKWRIKTLNAATIRFYVFREEFGTYHCIGRDERSIVPGLNEFDVDIPIQKGDFLFLNAFQQQNVFCLKIDTGHLALRDTSTRDYIPCSTYSFGTEWARSLMINADVSGR